MKLNESCMVAILEAVQSISTTDRGFKSKSDLDSIIGGYSNEMIMYHVRQCDLNGFLYGYKLYKDGSFEISDLTPKGHNYLEEYEKSSFWGKVKPASEKPKLPPKTIKILKLVAQNDNLISPFLVVNGCSDDENWPRLQQLFDENLLCQTQGYLEDGVTPCGPVLQITNEGKAFLSDYELSVKEKRSKDLRTIIITAFVTLVINWIPKIISYLISIIETLRS